MRAQTNKATILTTLLLACSPSPNAPDANVDATHADAAADARVDAFDLDAGMPRDMGTDVLDDDAGADDGAVDGGTDASLDASTPCSAAGYVCIPRVIGACAMPDEPDLLLQCSAPTQVCCMPATGTPMPCARSGGSCIAHTVGACPAPSRVGEPEIYLCDPGELCCLPAHP